MLGAMRLCPTLASLPPFFAASQRSLDASRVNTHLALLKNQSGEFHRRQRAPRSHLLIDESQHVVGQLVGLTWSGTCGNQTDQPQTLVGRQGFVESGPRETKSLRPLCLRRCCSF